MKRQADEMFVGWEKPKISGDLRERVLVTAKSQAQKPSIVSLEDRVWHSRVLRYAWLAAASILIAVNIMTFFPKSQTELVTATLSIEEITNDPQIVQLFERHQQSRTRLADSQQIIAKVLAFDNDICDTPDGEST